MKRNDSFFRSVCNLAIPVALQSMLQSSFSIVDQIMIGQLGSVNVAGVGLAGKFAGIYSVVVAAFGAVAGIMISQYLGQKKRGEVKRSYYLNLLFALVLAGIFIMVCVLLPDQIMGLYTKDTATRTAAAKYLCISPEHFSLWRVPRCWRLCSGVWRKPAIRCMPALRQLPPIPC